ncbi:hypothetical protein [Pseudomonas germanica]|jgi:outer membrane murein-binding lipoprotein Lpp|uniref:Uncharacterized protein n=1 Tax=Pseudomonas germanica TaxID=2815720 RepID=A0ABX8YX56_9PSED|nr:hypothetical protein [Pseudomonas germanica]QYY84600.1 hypothetical protein J0G10_14505 [Pseudomonas germanica]
MSVKDYLITKASAPVLSTALTSVKSAVVLAGIDSLGKTKANEFASEVVELVSSKAFVDKLSDDIGEPTELETEDQFIERAKKTMKALLKSKLK